MSKSKSVTEDKETHEDEYIDALMMLRLQVRSAELLSGTGWSRPFSDTTREVLTEALTLLIEKKKKEYDDKRKG